MNSPFIDIEEGYGFSIDMIALSPGTHGFQINDTAGRHVVLDQWQMVQLFSKLLTYVIKEGKLP